MQALAKFAPERGFACHLRHLVDPGSDPGARYPQPLAGDLTRPVEPETLSEGGLKVDYLRHRAAGGPRRPPTRVLEDNQASSAVPSTAETTDADRIPNFAALR